MYESTLPASSAIIKRNWVSDVHSLQNRVHNTATWSGCCQIIPGRFEVECIFLKIWIRAHLAAVRNGRSGATGSESPRFLCGYKFLSCLIMA